MKFDRSHPRGIGEQRFSIEECNFKGPFFYEGFSEYLPLVAIIGDNITSLDMGFSNSSYYHSGGNRKQQKIANNFHEKISTNIVDNGIYRVSKVGVPRNDGELSDLMEGYKNAIANFLSKKCGFELPDKHIIYQKATYDNLLRVIFGNKIKNYYFQSVKSISAGPGFVYSHALKDFLFCLVVPEELIEYQRLYFLLNGEFDPKGMEFWIQNKFDIPKSVYKSFRQSYRKNIKPKMEEWNIKFVEMNRIVDKMVPTFDVPVALHEIDEWKAKIARETLLKEREKLEFNFS